MSLCENLLFSNIFQNNIAIKICYEHFIDHELAVSRNLEFVCYILKYIKTVTILGLKEYDKTIQKYVIT